jgi:hypothetical protein
MKPVTTWLMLGALDESPIIRTIEYWDIERQRYPTYEHRAVIIAEEITARFFNVIRLLNRAVPLIAIQLTAIPLSKDEIILHGIKVLDIFEEAEPEEESAGEQVDRKYWERRASLYVRAFQCAQITLKLSLKDIKAHRALVLDLFRKCEAFSKVYE